MRIRNSKKKTKFNTETNNNQSWREKKIIEKKKKRINKYKTKSNSQVNVKKNFLIQQKIKNF